MEKMTAKREKDTKMHSELTINSLEARAICCTSHLLSEKRSWTLVCELHLLQAAQPDTATFCYDLDYKSSSEVRIVRHCLLLRSE